MDGLTLPAAMQNATNFAAGVFPWENDSALYGTYRNQYLYPSSTIVDSPALTIDSICARAASFTGASTNVYGSFANGEPSTIEVHGATSVILLRTFVLNPNGFTAARLEGTDANPIIMGTKFGSAGSQCSTCLSCIDDSWLDVGDIESGLPSQYGAGILIDTTLSVALGGNSGDTIWDTTFGFDPAIGRAWGGKASLNPNHLTTAAGVDSYGFVWVFEGIKCFAPPSTEKMIEDTVRILLDPERFGLVTDGLQQPDLEAAHPASDLASMPIEEVAR